MLAWPFADIEDLNVEGYFQNRGQACRPLLGSRTSGIRALRRAIRHAFLRAVKVGPYPYVVSRVPN